MIDNANYIKQFLEQIAQTASLKPSSPFIKAKKRYIRSGRHSPCHSCDKIDSPEWRRGPAGAGTLCKACGLQYAKAERKRQLEARS